jgi:hypothetical protein
MYHTRFLLGAALLGAALVANAPALAAQAAARRSGDEIQASFKAHQGEFDYLLGDWAFTAKNRAYGEIQGYWSAVRLAAGQILDEYRVVGDSGQTYYVTTTLRNYNGARDQWELVGADAGAGLQDVGTGHWVGGEMRIEQTFGVAAGQPSRWRIRYYDIRPDHFSWAADRSTDGGQTWVKDFQVLEARRTGPARSLGPLTTVRKP